MRSKPCLLKDKKAKIEKDMFLKISVYMWMWPSFQFNFILFYPHMTEYV